MPKPSTKRELLTVLWVSHCPTVYFTSVLLMHTQVQALEDQARALERISEDIREAINHRYEGQGANVNP